MERMRMLLRSRAWLAATLLLAAVMVGGAAAIAWWPAGTTARADVTPRAKLADYSWAELSAISDELASCTNERQAVACASRYGLCDQQGVLDAESVKSVELADGRTVDVVLVGICQDERTDGGVAGLTFAFADAVGPHAMNHAFEDVEGFDADSKGGWAACDMRAWLADTLWYQLPTDLRAQVVPVQKRTANTLDMNDELFDPGKLAGIAKDWVSETTDSLWLLSACELCGDVPAREDMGVDDSMSAVYAIEGTQYQLFFQQGVAAFAQNTSLVRSLAGEDEPCAWWLRTKTLEFGDGFWLVGTDGTPLNGLGEDVRVVEDAEYAPQEQWGPDHARGVVVGFCL